MKKSKILLLIFLPLVVAIISLGVGRVFIDPITIIKILTSQIIPIEETWAPVQEDRKSVV